MITIIGASWANEDRTAAVVNTKERGHKAISERDTPAEWTDFLAWQAAGNKVGTLEDGTAYKEEQQRVAARAAARTAAEAKLTPLGITADDLRALLDL